MSKWIALFLLGCVVSLAWADNPPLPTGKFITPPNVPEYGVGDMPLNLAVSPDGKYAVVTDIGYRQSLWSVSAEDGKTIDHVDYSTPQRSAQGENPTPQPNGGANGGGGGGFRGRGGANRSNGLYYGLAISADGTVYAAQGAHNSVAVFSLGSDGKLKANGQISGKAGDFPAGLALDQNGQLFVADNGASSNENDPFKTPGSVAIFDLTSRKELGRYVFSASYGGTSNFPFGIVATGDGSKVYVASERDDCVYALDTRDPSNPQLAGKISTGAHPVCVILNHDESRLFVANSLSDTISIVDTSSNQVIGTVLLRPKLMRDLPGVTPLGMALSPDQKTLYAALADMNAIAVIDVQNQTLSGYVPVGWYPTSLAVNGDGTKLLVVNGKGITPRLPNGKLPIGGRQRTGYSLNLVAGKIASIDIPTGDDLDKARDQVLENDRIDSVAASSENPLAGVKIQHVIYIIKENRTYDQIFGDIKQGNGDPSLVLFGDKVTPNEHALVQRFVLLDNLYACGEVSGDGWVWSTQGFANAYVQRNVPYSYSGKGRKFDFEGQNSGYITGGFPAKGPDGKTLANNDEFQNGATPIPDVASTGMHLWDAARLAGVSIRNYGFYCSFTDRATGSPEMPDNYPDCPGLQPPGHDTQGITDIDYRRFDLDYPDSDAPFLDYKQTNDPNCLRAETKYGNYAEPSRFSEWNHEFKEMLAKSPDGSAVPALMMLRMGTDHTQAAQGGKHTPRSMVADNDFAIGQVVQAVSNSPIWSSTAIFVIEDDAQNGQDHVDCHRTTGLVISPWIKANSVDHRFYNTDSFLRTIELLLGIHPLCQFDAVADPIQDWDSAATNADPFKAIRPDEGIIAETNADAGAFNMGDPRRVNAEESAQMDFIHPDSAPADETNRIVWQTIKGFGTPIPPPKGVVDDDDD